MAGRRRKSKGGHSIRVGTVLALSTLGAGLPADAKTRKVVALDMRRPRWLSPGFMGPGRPTADAAGGALPDEAEDQGVYPR